MAITSGSETFIPERRKKNGVSNAKATTRNRCWVTRWRWKVRDSAKLAEQLPAAIIIVNEEARIRDFLPQLDELVEDRACDSR